MKQTKHIITLVALILVGQINAQNFQDKPGEETDGDFPEKWDLIKGSAQIATFEGDKIIRFGNNAIITPFLESKNYLADEFTLEFDAYFDDVEKVINYQYYQIRFWDGYGADTSPTSNGSVATFPLKIFRHGAQLEHTIRDPQARKETHKDFIVTLEGKEALWRHIAIHYKKSAFKLSIDGTQILNIPRPKFTPKMISIEGAYYQFEKDYTRAVKNVVLIGKPNGTEEKPSIPPM